jgi:hypothetical protein
MATSPMRARPPKAPRDPMSAGGGGGTRPPGSRGAPPGTGTATATAVEDEEHDEDDEDDDAEAEDEEDENDTTIRPERSERSERGGPPAPSGSRTTSAGTPSEAGGLDRSSISTAAGGARKSSTAAKKGPKSTLPPEKVFPIQIGSQLFRLSGASIASDGQYGGPPRRTVRRPLNS